MVCHNRYRPVPRLDGVQHPEQVGGIVGVHGLEHVGGTFGVQLHHHVGLLVLRQFLQYVGQPLVIECANQFVSAFERQLTDRLGDLDRALALELLQQLRTPWPGSASADGVSPCTRCQSTMWKLEIHYHYIHSGKLRQLPVVDAHPRLEHLSEHQHVTGPLGETPQRHIGRIQRYRVRLDRRHAHDRDENPSAGEQFDNKTERAAAGARC
jgi:hypothetical protein